MAVINALFIIRIWPVKSGKVLFRTKLRRVMNQNVTRFNFIKSSANLSKLFLRPVPGRSKNPESLRVFFFIRPFPVRGRCTVFLRKVLLAALNARINACRIVWREGYAARGKNGKEKQKKDMLRHYLLNGPPLTAIQACSGRCKIPVRSSMRTGSIIGMANDDCQTKYVGLSRWGKSWRSQTEKRDPLRRSE